MCENLILKMKKESGTLIGLIALLILIGFLQAGCGEKSEHERKVQGTVTADAAGTVSFMYSRMRKAHPESCSFTTNLPSPYDQFVVSVGSGESTGKKEITGLTVGQKIEWTATVAGKPLNHGSEHFVHIVND